MKRHESKRNWVLAGMGLLALLFITPKRENKMTETIRLTEDGNLFVSTIKDDPDYVAIMSEQGEFETLARRQPYEYTVRSKTREMALEVHDYLVAKLTKKPKLTDRIKHRLIWLFSIWSARLGSSFGDKFGDEIEKRFGYKTPTIGLMTDNRLLPWWRKAKKK